MCGTTSAIAGISTVAEQAVIAGGGIVDIHAAGFGIAGVIGTDVEIIAGDGRTACAETAGTVLARAAGVIVITCLGITIRVGTVDEQVAIVINQVIADFSRHKAIVHIGGVG
jgi:hypothetical protein